MTRPNPGEHLCWICRQRKANSKEHKFKASDLSRLFGKSGWTKANGPVHGVGGKELASPQGPRAAAMTFGKVVCEQCNNQETQLSDRAYDVLIAWSQDNKERLLRERRINFEEVYGINCEVSQLNLFRYFAKHIGCNIARCNGHSVPEDLREILQQSPFRTVLRVTFHVNTDLLLGPGLDEGLFLGPLAYHPPDETGIPTYCTHIIVGSLMIRLWYHAPTPEDATEWSANKMVVDLGAYSVLTKEQREEVKRRSQGLPHRPFFKGES